MSTYPTAIDGPSSLFVPRDKTLAAGLETTLTANAGAADTVIQVADTDAPGFASANGVLTIDSEQIFYTGKTATTFTGCSRGFNGSTAAAHTSGAPVRALFSSAYIKALQEALIAVQTVLGLAGSYAFALAAHSHAAGDVTSGVLDAARLPDMTGASAGVAGAKGAVPAPAAGDQAKYLRGDATWQTIASGSTAASGVSFTPAGTLASTNVQAALEELDTEKAAVGHTHAASGITFSPAGSVSSTTVQGAIAELDGEKAPVSHGHAASVISVSASGSMPAGNAQERLQELWAQKANQTITISAGSGLSGGGDLSANRSLSADVRTVFSRTGNVSANAGDYTASQVNHSGFSWLAGATTVQQALDTIRARIDTLESNLASNYYQKSYVDAGLNGKSSSTHTHNETGTSTSGPIG